jgi:hypothetical protein
MKIHKWKKTFSDPIKLLRGVGAVADRQSFPDCVYVSPKRYKEIKKIVYNECKKENPSATKAKIMYSAELFLLNYGPCELHGLPDQLVLVNVKGIQDNINR